jgi:3-methyladenine DNA glycosylase AlkD
MSRPPSPDSLAARANASLKALSNKRTAQQSKSYFKPHEEIWLYGVATPSLRAVEKEIFDAAGRYWSVEEATRFCDVLLRNRYLEPKGVGIMLLARYRRHFQKELLDSIKTWLMGNLCGNWAATDGLAGRILAPLLSRYPELIAEVQSWTGSENLWVRRSAAVGLVPLARRGEHLDAAYAVAESLFDNREDLIHKAIGWLLREAGKKEPERLKAFLLAHGPRIPRTTLRYAIERFSPEERKALLAQTRAQP